MILSEVILRSPDGRTAAIGQGDYNSAGDLVGYMLDSIDLNPAPLLVFTEEQRYRTGGLVMPGHRTMRSVLINGTIVASSQAESNRLRRELVEICGDHGADLVAIVFSPEDIEMQLLGTCEGSITFADRGGYQQTFSIRMVCADPIAHSTGTEVQISLGSTATAVENLGNAEVFPTYTIDILTGTLTALSIANASTNKTLELGALSLAAGQQIIVRTTPGLEAVKVDGSSLMAKRTASGRKFPHLRPGENTMTVTATGATVDAIVSYRHGWAS